MARVVVVLLAALAVVASVFGALPSSVLRDLHRLEHDLDNLEHSRQNAQDAEAFLQADTPISYKDCFDGDVSGEWGYLPKTDPFGDGKEWDAHMRCADHPSTQSGKVAGFNWCYTDTERNWKQCTRATYKERGGGQLNYKDRTAARQLKIWKKIFGTKTLTFGDGSGAGQTSGKSFLGNLGVSDPDVCTATNYWKPSECPNGLCCTNKLHDARIVQAVVNDGNIAPFSAILYPVVIRKPGAPSASTGGVSRNPQFVVWVQEDSIAVGKDTDYYRPAISGLGSRCIVEKVPGTAIPTIYIIDQVFDAAVFKLLDDGLYRNWKKPDKDPNAGQECTGWSWINHGRVQKKLNDLGYTAGSGIVSGHRKEVAIVGNCRRNNMFMFGFWEMGVSDVPAGEAGAVHSARNAFAHTNPYSDYAQSTRLISDTVKVLEDPENANDWTELAYADAMKEKKYAAVLNAGKTTAKGKPAYIDENGATNPNIKECYTYSTTEGTAIIKELNNVAPGCIAPPGKKW